MSLVQLRRPKAISGLFFSYSSDTCNISDKFVSIVSLTHPLKTKSHFSLVFFPIPVIPPTFLTSLFQSFLILPEMPL